MKWLCRIGWHRWRIIAEIYCTRFEVCTRCHRMRAR